MNVSIIKHTDLEEAQRAIETTVDREIISSATLDQIYTWLHSPIRTQLFEIFLEDIPTFVSVHLVRHVTTQPFVTSKRPNKGVFACESPDTPVNRYTPVDMRIWANAESIITMAGKRLCFKASKETREVMQNIKAAILDIDPDLARHMVPNCALQGGYCREPKPCGEYRVKRYDPTKILQKITIEENW